MNPLTGVLAEAWAMYKAHARHLLTIAFVIYVASAIVQAVLTGLLGWLGALLAGIVGLITTFLLQATLVKAVDDVRDGRADMSIGDTVNAAKPFIGQVAVASILAGIAIAIGLILLIVPGLFLITVWCLIVPVIVLERVPAMESFGRSRQLVSGFGGQVFGTLVLVFVVLIAVNIVLGLVLTALPDGIQNGVSSVVSGTLISPYLSLVLTLGYFRLRAAHEHRTV
jgi:hypothetical protein